MTCSTRAIAVIGLLILGGGFAAVAAEPAPQSQSLPDPLTLDAALSLSDARYPALEQAQADVRQAEADRDSISAGNGIQASLQGRLRWIEPASVAPNQQHDDNHIRSYGIAPRRGRVRRARPGIAIHRCARPPPFGGDGGLFQCSAG